VGAAKRRGTFEERKALAIKRDAGKKPVGRKKRRTSPAGNLMATVTALSTTNLNDRLFYYINPRRNT